VFAILLLALSQVDSFAATPITTTKPTTALKATWYTGDVLGFRGAGGKLKSGNSIAINNAQRKAWKIRYGQRVYLKFPKRFKALSGWYDVRDCGCSKGIVDLFFASKSAVPKKFRRAGIVKNVKIYKKVKRTKQRPKRTKK
jgi:hypothetical protein